MGFIICTAFNKPMVLLTDYRDAYVGSYFCNSSCQGLNSQHTALTTNNGTTTIGVAKDLLDSILKITIGKSTYQVKLKNNRMYAYPVGRHWGGKFFAADSIGFTASVSLAPNACSYTGKKN